MRLAVVLTPLVAAALFLCCVDGTTPYWLSPFYHSQMRSRPVSEWKFGLRPPGPGQMGYLPSFRRYRMPGPTLRLQSGSPTQERTGSQSPARTAEPVVARPTANDERATNRTSNNTGGPHPTRVVPLQREDIHTVEQRQGLVSVAPIIPGAGIHGGTRPSRPYIETERRHSEMPGSRERGTDPTAMNERDLVRPTRPGSHEDRRYHSERRHHTDIRRPGDHSGRRPEHRPHGHHRGSLDHPPHPGGSDEKRDPRMNWTVDQSRARPDWMGGTYHSRRLGGSISSSSSEEERGEIEHESAPYNVICASPEVYELRQYEEAVWATTMVNCSSSGCEKSWFRRLSRYISGENDQDVEIPMSAPIRRRMVERQDGENSTRDVLVSASFYLPRRFWDEPPAPRDNEVFLEKSASLVFTSNFSGWADHESMSRQYSRLRDMLEQEEHSVVEGEFAIQSYNSPWEVIDRHSEVSIEADTALGIPTCSPQTTEELPHTTQTTEEPPNGIKQCGNRECPQYSEGDRINNAVVIREVGAGVYATKTSATCNMTNVFDDTYEPLHRYFQGANMEGVSMPRTTPILQLAVTPDRSDSACNFTYQSAFYIPEEYQNTPPTPLEESIVISETDPVLYYVMTFQENPTTRIAFQKYNELKSLVTEAGQCYGAGEFRLAFYDAPFRPLPHRYEMWIPVNEQCNDVAEDFDDAALRIDEDENVILPLLSDDPEPLPYDPAKKRQMLMSMLRRAYRQRYFLSG